MRIRAFVIGGENLGRSVKKQFVTIRGDQFAMRWIVEAISHRVGRTDDARAEEDEENEQRWLAGAELKWTEQIP